MTPVNVQTANAHLPEPPDGVERRIADARRASRARAAFFGSMRGQIDMSRFDEADEEIAREFGMLD